jgi:hypothetical protein
VADNLCRKRKGRRVELGAAGPLMRPINQSISNVSIGGSVAAGSYDANSASTVARSLRQHAEQLHQHMEVSTRAAASTSIGEVQTRNHQQGESEDHTNRPLAPSPIPIAAMPLRSCSTASTNAKRLSSSW